MRLKRQKENRCPACGRADAAHRISRRWFVRLFTPKSALMRCRLCLTHYFVRRPPES